MKIKNYSVKGLFVSQGCNVFGEGRDAVNYNYIKVLKGEEVIVIKVPQDKVADVQKANFEEYQLIEILVDIEMELDSKVSSKYKTVLALAEVLPFDIEKPKKGDK